MLIKNIRDPNQWGQVSIYVIWNGARQRPTGENTPLVIMLSEALFLTTNVVFDYSTSIRFDRYAKLLFLLIELRFVGRLNLSHSCVLPFWTPLTLSLSVWPSAVFLCGINKLHILSVK